jgi:hypothetical protein
VIGTAPGQIGTWSTIGSFTTIPPLAAPTLISPEDGSSENSNLPIFTWSAIPGATSYRLAVVTNSSDLPDYPTGSVGTSTFVFDENTSSPSFTVSKPLMNGTTYYWEVIGISATQIGTWSAIDSFTPGLATPVLTPIIANPVPPEPTFSWSSVVDATAYRLIVASNAFDLPNNSTATTGGSSVVIDVLVSTNSYVPTAPLGESINYNWEVIALAPGQGSAWSRISSFAFTAPISAPSSGFSPSMIDQAYGINQVSYNGAGQTIAVVDLYNNPNIQQDLTAFDQEYSLPAPPAFTVVDENGNPINPMLELPPPSGPSDSASEIDLDVEWAHAIAPAANILLVETLNSGDSDSAIQSAIQAAANYPDVSVVSMSLGGAVFTGNPSSVFSTLPGHIPVTFIASSGDTGIYAAPNVNATIQHNTVGVDYPAGFSNVLSVGGTTLQVFDSSGTWAGESLWTDSGDPYDGAGYGVSSTVPEPAYQTADISSAGGRSVPDVSFDADPNTGVAIYDSYDDPGVPWTVIGGTSLSAPAWAGLISIVDQERVGNGMTTLDTATALSDLYQLPSADFHKTGSSSYNTGTGLGTPIANKLVPDLLGAPPTITSANNATFVLGENNQFAVTASGIPGSTIEEVGALPRGISFVVNGSGAASLSGAPVAGSGGIYVLTFTAENGVLPIAVQSFTLTVDQAPAINSNHVVTFTTGVAGTFTVTTSGFPTATMSESGLLPSGVTLVDNGNGTATLSGTPVAGTAGTYVLTLTAVNAVLPAATQTFTLTVDNTPVVSVPNAPPSITSPNNATFLTGVAGLFTISSNASPTDALTETGPLPSGLRFVDNGNGTGTLSGTPADGAGGTYVLAIKAKNGTKPNGKQTFTLTVDEAPSFTSANTSIFTIGTVGKFNVTTLGFPTAAIMEAGVLPKGVKFVDKGDGMAKLRGTPAAGTAGSYRITLKAKNGLKPRATELFTLVIDSEFSAAVNPAISGVEGLTGAENRFDAILLGSAGNDTLLT